MVITISESDLAKLKQDGEITIKIEPEGISLHKAFDEYCRHDGVPYPVIGDLRKKPHWFEVVCVKEQDSTFKIGDRILVTRGYVTNVTQGWTFDPLEEGRQTCGPSHGGTDWVKWKPNRCVCFIHVLVKVLEK